MSVNGQIDRIKSAKADIISAIKGKGVSVPDGAGIDTLDGYIGEIVNGSEADYNLVFVLSDGTTASVGEVEEMGIPQGDVMRIENSSGEVLWEYTLPSADPVLDNNTWWVISQVSKAGIASTMWSVGDRKAVMVNGKIGTSQSPTAVLFNMTSYVYIIGFDHNGAQNAIDFGTFKTAYSGGYDICLVEQTTKNGTSTNGLKYYNMNHSAGTNAGGWRDCDLRHDLLGSTHLKGANAGETTATNPVSDTLMAALPEELRAVMRPMEVATDNVGGSVNTATNISSSIDYLPLLSEYEVFGARTYANPSEQNYQAQYSYYAAGNSKMKYPHYTTAESINWWLRSPSANNSFCVSSLWGKAHSVVASTSIGLAPIFRV